VCQLCSDLLKNLSGLLFDSEDNMHFDEYVKHIKLAESERNYFIAQKNETILEFKKFDRENNKLSQYTGKAHYCFDFAQNLKFPNHAFQTGPIYFKNPRSCHLFGISCANTGNQFNYLIDEADIISKNPDLVISLIHDFLENDEIFKPKKLLFHADNCVSQNKNNAVMQYFMWRIILGLNYEIEISFMITGHTKFDCDKGFGHIKRKYLKSDCETIIDISNVV
jgi:hypothetical protein